VVGIKANIVSPAIENDGSSGAYLHFIGNADCSKGSMQCDFVAGDHCVISHCNGGIGMLKSSLCAGEGFNAAVVVFFEVCLKVCHGVLCNWLVLPFIDGTMENAHVFEDSECEMHCSGIGDSLATGCCKDLAFTDAFPQVFD